MSILWRGGWLGRRMRAGVAWFALLGLALPGFASVRGLCCEPDLAKRTDCCATSMEKRAMKMPGMDSSEMAAMMDTARAADSSVANPSLVVAATRCASVPSSESSEFFVQNEGAFDGSLLLTRDFHPALAWNLGAGESSSVTTALLLVEDTPPRLLLCDSLSLVLRI
jgi:hypothetical protein